MPDFRAVSQAVGVLLLAFSAVALIPALVSVGASGTDWREFVATAALTLFVGGAMVLAGRGGKFRMGMREGFLMTTVSWLVLCAVAALPFHLRDGGMSYTDSFFEAMSGLTTTGGTVIVGLDVMPRSLLLWRSLLQWVGGLGIVLIAIMILPFLRVGGMQLFRAESSDRSEKVVARPIQFALYVTFIYASLTLACGLSFAATGMGGFDAINHAMATVSTGGFSTHDVSFGVFEQPAIHWVGIVFMAAGALPFVLYIKTLKGDWHTLWRDEQVRGFAALLAVATAILTLWLWVDQMAFWPALRLTAFNVVSVVTTTGFVSADYGLWGAFPTGAFLILMFFGGCSGSTSGGIKIFRHQVMLLMMGEQVRRLIAPHVVVSHRYNGARLPPDVVPAVVAFLAAYFAAIAVLTVAVSAFGIDLVTSVSAVVASIGNVGPGLGATVGPAGTYAPLPDGAKWLLSLAMLLGRLELFTVLVVFTPMFWRT